MQTLYASCLIHKQQQQQQQTKKKDITIPNLLFLFEQMSMKMIASVLLMLCLLLSPLIHGVSGFHPPLQLTIHSNSNCRVCPRSSTKNAPGQQQLPMLLQPSASNGVDDAVATSSAPSSNWLATAASRAAAVLAVSAAVAVGGPACKLLQACSKSSGQGRNGKHKS